MRKTEHICIHCGASFIGAPHALFCLDCKIERRRESVRKHKAKKRAESEKRPELCRVCGGVIPAGSARRKYCSLRCSNIAKAYQSSVSSYRGRRMQTPPEWDEWMERYGITTSPVHEINPVKVVALTRIDGKLLRELRRERKLTQKEVADRLGISCSAYRNYEIGQLKDVGRIERLAYFFDVPVDKLIQKDPPAKRINLVHDIASDIEMGEVTFKEKTYKLNEEERRRLQEFLTTFFRKFD